MIDRRSFLRSFLAAPAIVCAANLMPIKAIAGLVSPELGAWTIVAPDGSSKVFQVRFKFLTAIGV